MNAQSVNEATEIAALFGAGAVAYQTREALSADTLLPAEQAFLARAVPKRVHEFAGGRACARAGLARLGHVDAPLTIGEDRAPRWPSGITGSITHTDGFCAAVVAEISNIRALGLDVESADSVKPHLWHRICCADELEFIQTLDATAAVEAATLIFSAKEAFYKCQHFLTGQWLGFHDVSITLEAEGFAVRANRDTRLAEHAPGPWRGRYRREGDLVMTGVCII